MFFDRELPRICGYVDRYIVPIELKLHANALSEWRVGAVSILRETCRAD
jgi:hypothetical protein